MTTLPHVPLSSRQRFALALLHALGGTVGNLDFQKLLFLRCQEDGASAPYEFVPYLYGAFSFTSYADRRKLVERGLLRDEVDHWQLTPEGRDVVKSAGTDGDRQLTFAREHRDLRGDRLVAETYRRFPYYATKSMIATRVLHGDQATLDKIDAARSGAQASGILTIGYEGHSLERYLNQLITNGVTILCDVRRNAISRKYGFSLRTLANACDGVGVRYEHLPALGIASDRRQNLASQADYDALFRDYERRHLPTQSESLDSIGGCVQRNACVALTCYEHLPKQCHRHCVAEALEEKFGKHFAPKHL